MTLKRTVCNRDCPDTCGIIATVENGRVTRLRGDPDHPITRGFLCYRTHQFLERQYSSERLLSPLLRVNGTLTEVSFDHALDHIAEGLLRIRKQEGPAAIFHYRSGGSLGMLKTLADRFFEHFGPVTTKHGDICSGAGDAAQNLDFGISDSSDPQTLLKSRHIILWGKNVHVSSPHTIPILKQARANGAELTLIDPVAHEGVRLAKRHICPVPGGDLPLALATGRVLFEQGLVDPAANNYCDNLEEYRRLCFSQTVEQWSHRAALDPNVPVELARQLGDSQPCAILVGWGMGRRTNGGSIIRAIDALAAVSGNLGVEGGGASFYYQRRNAFDPMLSEGAQNAPRTIDETHFAQGILEATSPPISALWVTAGNPVAMLPDSQSSARAVRSLPLSVVVDSFLTDTARCATVVLPTTTLLEDDDIFGSYGTPYLAVSEPVVASPRQVRSDLLILQGLAERVGLTELMAGTAHDWKERMLSVQTQRLGVTVESLRSGAQRNPAAPQVLFENRRFPTKTGKVQLLTQAPLSHPVAQSQFPLQLMALSTRHSQSAQWAGASPSPLTVTVHPLSAANIPEGGHGLLQSLLGSLKVCVRHDARQRRDIALLPKGGHHHLNASANAIVQAKSTDLGNGGALYEEPVRLIALPPSKR